MVKRRNGKQVSQVEKCSVCGDGFNYDEVRKQVKHRPRNAISQHIAATVHARCLEEYKRKMAQEHGQDWEQNLDIEVVDAYKT